MPFAAPKPTHYACTNCGYVFSTEQDLPERCPQCEHPKEAYVLVEED